MDIQSLLKQLTLEEKAALCIGMTAWKTVPVERLGIPSIYVSDGPHGVRKAEGVGEGKALPATCFPTFSALAATWDVDLIHTMGQALADECIALDVDIVLGPGNNMKRTPLCGRNFEYFSEDPYLAGEMASHFIDGVQSKGVGTSLKHFAANNQETERNTISAEIDERTLHEIYLAGFERAVKKSQPWTVMCSYNLINGTRCSEDRRLLTDILKGDWGFEGFVVSDWGAVHNRVKALAAGVDLEMPGPQAKRVERVIEAVRSGEIDPAVLDAAVERILKIVEKAIQTKKGHTKIDVASHHALARRLASEAIVLLKNENNLLPLSNVKKIAIIGQSAKEAHFQGGGSSHINPTKVDVPFDEIKKLAGNAELSYAQGYTMKPGFQPELIGEAVKIAVGADVALLFVALPPYKDNEGNDRPDMELSEQQVTLINAVAAVQPKCVVILNNGSAIDMRAWIDGAAAVVEAYLFGQAGGGAVADVLFGKVNPSGRLAETFPFKINDTPAYTNFPGENGKVRYGEGLFIGYRYYEARQADVQFPFGFGLSYTTFELSNMRLSSETIKDMDELTVSVDVTNTGKVAGKTVVQIYVHPQQAALARPYKELKGFAKVELRPGKTKTVSITLEPRAFAYYDPSFKTWVTESGSYDILVGQSSADISLEKTITMQSTQNLHKPLHLFSMLKDWMADPRGSALIKDTLEQAVTQFTNETGEQALATEVIGWAKELPLDMIFTFWGRGDLPAAPEEMVQNLLDQLEE